MKVKDLKKKLNCYNDDLDILFGMKIEYGMDAESDYFSNCSVEIKLSPTSESLEIIVK